MGLGLKTILTCYEGFGIVYKPEWYQEHYNTLTYNLDSLNTNIIVLRHHCRIYLRSVRRHYFFINEVGDFIAGRKGVQMQHMQGTSMLKNQFRNH